MQNINNYIIVLGGGIDLQGKLPAHQFARLDKAIELHRKYPESKIILSGKYSFLYEEEKPPLTEAKAMQNYLVAKNISQEELILEEYSMDTIGNVYYIKKYILRDSMYQKLIFITSEFHLERVKFIVGKFFDPKLTEFIGTKDSMSGEKEVQIIKRQKELLEKTKKYLRDMKHGDVNYLENRIYKDWYYQESRPDWVKNFVSKGK